MITYIFYLKIREKNFEVKKNGVKRPTSIDEINNNTIKKRLIYEGEWQSYYYMFGGSKE